MSGWIKWEKDIESDPRFVRMVRHARVTHERDGSVTGALPLVTLVTGALLRFWVYADTHIRSDDTLDLGTADIDDLVGVPGFATSMPEDWLRVIDDHTVELPGYQEHNGVEAKKRDLAAKRQERKRVREKRTTVTQERDDSVTGALPDQTRPDQTRKRKRVPTEPVPHGGTEAGEGNGRPGEGSPPKDPPSKLLDVGAAIGRVFEHWRTTHEHPRAQLDRKRTEAIKRALRAYAEADLCQAISGYLNSPHHMGDNDRNAVYDDIELFLRDAKHIDAGLAFYANPPRTDLSAKSRRIVSQTEDWTPPEGRNASS